VTTPDQPRVDIFVRTSHTEFDDVNVDDIVFFYGVRCVEEKIFVKSSSLQMTVFRLLLPNDGPVDRKILSPDHSWYKEVSPFRPCRLRLSLFGRSHR
jgi:hypothetical protein